MSRNAANNQPDARQHSNQSGYQQMGFTWGGQPPQHDPSAPQTAPKPPNPKDIDEFNRNAAEFKKKRKKKLVRNYCIAVGILTGVGFAVKAALTALGTMTASITTAITGTIAPGSAAQPETLASRPGLTYLIVLVLLFIIAAGALAIINRPKPPNPQNPGGRYV